MIFLIILASYIVAGMISTRALLPSFWARALTKDYSRSELEGPSGYVAALATTNFLFFPVLAPIHILLGASHKMNPENLELELKKKTKELEQSHKYTNALEKANNMEITQW